MVWDELMGLTLAGLVNPIRTKHYLLFALLLIVSGPAWSGTWHYGYGFNPDDAMRAAIAAAKRESRARCLGKDWKPDIDRDCEFAGKGRSYFDKNGKNLGPYECRAAGSNHKGSCR